MLLNKVPIGFLAVLFTPLAVNAGLTSSVNCPSAITSHRYALIGARLFDGPPEELTELVPDHERGGTWDISGYKNSDRNLILVCDYAQDQRRELLVPKTASSCTIQRHKKLTVRCR